MKEFTKEELEKFNGSGNPAYVAVDGRVYDVSESFLWEMGSHQGKHQAGTDLTDAIKEAPHPAERLKKFPVVGELK